ncbi:LamG domain-containing protein [Sedimentisphaera salicampi]|uniref:LamG domain-containing protein n=1 Tax=Sedimentisphaera salicampi TaxID=1941349 RepID=UPI000B9D09BF|nr:LamG domain-containing protein [Sedimentisphaera salicampi]OXU15165.1 hypothetical protein SMSP1_01096 [Sedimentisphaera salicampi]
MKTKKQKAICLLGLILSAGLVFGSVQFDSMAWYHSHNPQRLELNDRGQLVWYPGKPHQLTAHLPEQSLEEVGDSLTLRYFWQSRGDKLGCDCHDNISGGGDCDFDDDVTCLAGTGDFRIGLFDSNSQGYISSDNYGEENGIFTGYLGYQWRFHPHICDTERFWEHKSDGSRESHTNVSCWKRDEPFIDEIDTEPWPCSRELLGDCDPRSWTRIFDPVPACFALGFDQWAELVLKIERVSQGIKTTFSFNGLSYSVTDTSSSYQPQKIDTLAIHFSNARPYDYVVLAAEEPLKADINDDCVVENGDLMKFSEGWLEKGDCLLPSLNSDNLLLRYKFNESAGETAADSSGRNMDGQVSGNGDWIDQGWEGNCLQFNDDTSVSPPPETLSNLGEAVVFTCWLKGGDASGRDNWVFDVGDDPYISARVPDALGNVVWHAAGDTLVWKDSTAADWRGSWVHYAFVKNAAAGHMAIYRNGEKVAERTDANGSLASIPNTGFDIGAKRSHANDYIGLIDEFRVYNLTIDDPGPDPDKLMLWYKFDQSEGNIAADSSGHNMDGNISGSGDWSSEGWKGRCLKFDNDTVVNPPNATLSNIGEAVTFTCWVKGGNFLSHNNWLFDAGHYPYVNARVPDSSGNVVWHAAGDTLIWEDAASSDWQGSWVHYAFVKDADEGFMAIYRNGEKVAEKNDAYGSLAGVRSTVFDIGAKRSHANDYIGLIDDFRVYNYVLSKSEINSLISNRRFSKIDLTGDGRINLNDYVLLASHWLDECFEVQFDKFLARDS